MKLKFKHQAYQTHAVEAVTDCFEGQPKLEGNKYRIDPGTLKVSKDGFVQTEIEEDILGFKNEGIILSTSQVLENIQKVQRRQNIPQSITLPDIRKSSLNLDIEMETGTGKTYCYIKTFFELNKRYGWSKFIIVVPSIAIREGVYKSLEITADHFLESYHKRAKFFIYNSKQLHNLESYSSDAGINIMVINVQAFAIAPKPDASLKTILNQKNIIYRKLDDFQTRRPIDVIKANHPILILDEPQKMQGDKTLKAIKEFNPLMVLRYSATHKTTHNKVYRLDALDAYNQKLVKKIRVRGISTKGLTGTNAYLYLEEIEISNQSPVARMEIEIKHTNGIKRTIRKLKKGDNLFDLSNELDQYNGFVVSEINAHTNTVSFTNGVELASGDVLGDMNEMAIRRIQIREAIKSHFANEHVLFHQGIKVLTLFFIDEVAKYRKYTEAGEEGGEYAKIFEEEYLNCRNELPLLVESEYAQYLNQIEAERTHNGYFSIDKKTKRLIDPETGSRCTEADDVDAYDLILKDKERLLSFEEPTRFIFSHSALREGWDNPNVFVICTLKHSDSTVSRRQEVGRGLRLAVNQNGDRQDEPATVHDINVLTVIANESYTNFVSGLQQDIKESLSERPRIADVEYFTGKIIKTETGTVEITPQMAKQLYKYLVKNDYVDDQDHISQLYHDAVITESVAPLPDELSPYQEQIYQLIDSVFSDAKLPSIEDGRNVRENPLNDNFHKKEFQELWNRINHKAVYSVYFDSAELIEKCVKALDDDLEVNQMQYTIQAGEQTKTISYEELNKGESFKVTETTTEKHRQSIHSTVKYDLIGKIAEPVQLTRKTVSEILRKINKARFVQFKMNPEHFISETVRIINEQKATMIIEHLSYDTLAEKHDSIIFTEAQSKQDFTNAGEPLKRHIYDYVITDSKNERKFVKELDTSNEVVVYAKLPRGFAIPTPVGNYNPDWAIAFDKDKVKHVYFVAETKGTMSTMELRKIEETKIDCARKFFESINQRINPKNVTYQVVDSYSKLMDIVGVLPS